MTEIGTIIDGKYEILTEIGRGGMSIVYLAMDKRLNKQWAVKEIRKQSNGENDEIVVNSLLAEANLMKRLDHPSLPRIVDIIDNGITIYVIMDYIEGESLDKILDEYGAQPEEYVIGWTKQLCDALGYLHSQKPPIIYRDMKPANIMLKPEGNIKIIDFGIAREYKEQALSDTTVLGTKGYAPPEQYSGQTDPRSDIFALGMTMHHLLTGVDPRKNQVYAPVRQWNPELSEGIEIIIEKCVNPSPEKRYQSCEELLYDLEHPELITRDYKRHQKKKLRVFMICVIVFGSMLLLGAACKGGAYLINNSSYDTLISISTSTGLEEKIESYKQAILLYPERTEAYLLMLEAFEDAGQFGSEESSEFLAQFNTNKDMMDQSSLDYANLNYKSGMMYFNYYTDDDGSVNFGLRIQKAYPFFQTIHDLKENGKLSKQFEYTDVSECYYQICSFYKKYVLNTASVEEASKSDYDNLIKLINECMEKIKNAGGYDQLTFYNGVFNLMYDQRGTMHDVGVDQATIQGLIDQCYQKSVGLSVQKEQSKKLQQDIQNNYAGYKQEIAYLYSGK